MKTVKAISIAALILTGIAAIVWLKVDAYGGDIGCLFAKCIKVK